MSEFIWQNHYLIGNQRVDQQHQQLFELANELVQSKTQADLAENAANLYQHVKEHFQCEEAFMKAHDYPHFKKHAETHELMLNKLVDVRTKIDRHEWQTQDVLIFMRQWISHILDEDEAFNVFFQDNPASQAANF